CAGKAARTARWKRASWRSQRKKPTSSRRKRRRFEAHGHCRQVVETGGRGGLPRGGFIAARLAGARQRAASLAPGEGRSGTIAPALGVDRAVHRWLRGAGFLAVLPGSQV